MKNTMKVALITVAALLVSLPVLAQDHAHPGSSAGGGGSTASIASRGIASSTPSTTTTTVTTTTSRDYSSTSGSRTGDGVRSSGTGGGFVPSLQGTSFNTLNYYYQWQGFYYYLQSRYYMNADYFDRFYRNREPLLTPELLKLTVRQPLKLSMQLLEAVDNLELLIKDREAGKPVDRQAIAAKAQEIRDLAKNIRQDQSLTLFDQRRDKDIFKGTQVDKLGPEAVAQLREMATDLNTQLKSMYVGSQSSTVSIDSLTAPSFSSLTKGIDKLTKVIENSSRRM